MFSVRKTVLKFFVFCLCSLNLDAANELTSGDIAMAADMIGQALIFRLLGHFRDCLRMSMPNQEFTLDNLQRFVYSPAKTTVGFAPKFTSNRKFFANMLASAPFKEMLARDEDKLRKDLKRKMKLCYSALMDNQTRKDFYDRETDQSKL